MDQLQVVHHWALVVIRRGTRHCVLGAAAGAMLTDIHNRTSVKWRHALIRVAAAIVAAGTAPNSRDQTGGNGIMDDHRQFITTVTSTLEVRAIRNLEPKQ